MLRKHLLHWWHVVAQDEVDSGFWTKCVCGFVLLVLCSTTPASLSANGNKANTLGSV